MKETDFGDLSRFVRYAQKMFGLNLLAGSFTDSRPEPVVPSRSVWLTLLLGEVAHIPSFLQLQAETRLPQWQQWVGYHHPISDDTLGYVSERMDPAQLRQGAVWINRKLKKGKAFEESKVNGLLAASLELSANLTDQAIQLFDRMVSALFRKVEAKEARSF